MDSKDLRVVGEEMLELLQIFTRQVQLRAQTSLRAVEAWVPIKRTGTKELGFLSQPIMKRSFQNIGYCLSTCPQSEQ